MLNTTELSIKMVNMEKFVMHCYHNKKIANWKHLKNVKRMYSLIKL